MSLSDLPLGALIGFFVGIAMNELLQTRQPLSLVIVCIISMLFFMLLFRLGAMARAAWRARRAASTPPAKPASPQGTAPGPGPSAPDPLALHTRPRLLFRSRR